MEKWKARIRGTRVMVSVILDAALVLRSGVGSRGLHRPADRTHRVKFKAGENLPVEAAEIVRESGCAAGTVGDEHLSRSDDEVPTSTSRPGFQVAHSRGATR